MRTLQDVIEEGGAAPYASRLIERGGATMFRCRCGRLVAPELMLEVRPPEGGGVPERLCGRDRFRCDGCWTRWVRGGEICPDELRRVTSQPARASPYQPW